MFADFLDLNHPLLKTREAVLSGDACERYIERFHAEKAELAPIVGPQGEAIDLTLRNNTRIMWDSFEEAAELLDRARPIVPSNFKGQRLVGANERLRIYRYAPGEKHSAHWDTEVELPGRRSRVTLVFYLNDDFEGGHTAFPELGESIAPKRGQALCFQHRVLHTAQPVESGAKFVLRTDIFYESA
ncbi:MAG: 2OG-Fe(II) oxygenase [Myxococcota bacterium]